MCIPQTHTYYYQEMTNFMYLPIHDSTFNFPQFHIFSKLEFMLTTENVICHAIIISRKISDTNIKSYPFLFMIGMISAKHF